MAALAAVEVEEVERVKRRMRWCRELVDWVRRMPFYGTIGVELRPGERNATAPLGYGDVDVDSVEDSEDDKDEMVEEEDWLVDKLVGERRWSTSTPLTSKVWTVLDSGVGLIL